MTNRSLKFRAWDKEKKEMLPAIHIFINGAGVVWENKRGGLEGSDELLSTNRFNIMRFTGLLDKNGVEVWEDDILAWGEGGKKVCVEWKDGAFGFREEGGFTRLSSFFGGGEGYLEVVGNVHRSPELLK